MSMSDPIADMLTRIRNAQTVRKEMVEVQATKIKIAIACVLQSEGYINSYKIENINNHNRLLIALKYYNGKPVIEMIKRISKPGLRVYCSKDKLPSVNDGLGIAIISCSKGVMSDRAARIHGEGGEVLCYVS